MCNINKKKKNKINHFYDCKPFACHFDSEKSASWNRQVAALMLTVTAVDNDGVCWCWWR